MLISELIKQLEEIKKTNWDKIIKYNWVEFEEYACCNCRDKNEDITGIEIEKDFILIT